MDLYSEKKQQYISLITKESKTKEDKVLIHTLSMEISELKKERKLEWKKNNPPGVKKEKKEDVKIEDEEGQWKEYKHDSENDEKLQDALQLIEKM